MNKVRIFGGRANLPLAEEIVTHLGMSLNETTIQNFKDGETGVEIRDSVRDMDVFIIQSVCSSVSGDLALSVNDSLVELLLMIDAARRASARRVTAIIPYYAYARQEKKTPGRREAISAKLVANLLTTAGADHVLAVEMHAPAIEGFFDIPVDNLPVHRILADYFSKFSLPDVVVAAPDIGAVPRADRVRRLLGENIPLVIVIKQRPEPDVAEVEGMVGDVRGKSVILIDDLISTGGTIIEAAKFLIQEGAREVHACATHPVFAPGAMEELRASPVKKVVVTNTIPVPLKRGDDKFEVLNVARLLARAIQFINEGHTMTELYEGLGAEPLAKC